MKHLLLTPLDSATVSILASDKAAATSAATRPSPTPGARVRFLTFIRWIGRGQRTPLPCWRRFKPSQKQRSITGCSRGLTITPTRLKMLVQKTELLTYNIRRGQMPGMELETYQKLQQGEMVEVSDDLGEWLVGRGYSTKVSGD